MELVMLRKINKEDLLSSVDEKKRQEQQKEEVVGNVVIYDPSPTKVVDVVISKKLAELKRAEIEKIKTEEAETEKFKNAVTLTDVTATIKKAGFYPDGSPKVAIAGLFDRDVRFIVRDGQAKYCSDSLSVILADVKNDWKNLICFFVGIALVIESVFIAFCAFPVSLEDEIYYSRIVIPLVGIFIPFGTLIFVTFAQKSESHENYFTYLAIPGIGKVRTRSNFFTNVPLAPESVLTKISGHGPFAILFEATEGWRKVKPDPVILRIIDIKGKQFFEAVVGYDMTPLEKSSLVEI